MYVPDAGADRRWSLSCVRMAKELGVGSLPSCWLLMDASSARTLGVFNCTVWGYYPASGRRKGWRLMTAGRRPGGKPSSGSWVLC